ncbi:ABC transporter substrate-binding protein [Corticibacter populi]|uniref:ABC transporter substrate-binding protein n=1 Tax=Corticibacter populi TaxID=1550736 RepID=A0A3M6QTI1_9BURK|nr:ABC transporter substrate-binding protein [Corticibacter populi]RMX06344.1 ABC transporter substrate-binding protein [Corticibacter populi]RZS32114.1 carbohydrate ABC transporter substrate-binding protein (CUT1 family) [Corticibacter populi]
MQRKTFLKTLAATAATALAWPLAMTAAQAQTAVDVPFFYPVNVGGPINKLIDAYAEDFGRAHAGTQIKPIYSGNYQETLVKALTGFKSGTPPVTAVLLSTDMFTLIDEEAIVPFDEFIKTDEDRAWLRSFYPAFLKNSQTDGKTWGIPFQRSTVVIYWNKELFKEAGLDPERGPANWQELREYAQKLTKKDANGNVTTWGVQIPSSGFPYWLFQTLTTPNDVILANDKGTAVNLDDPKAIEALEYWVGLAKDGLHPAGVVEWGTTPKDFFEKKAAIVVTTTGNLTNIRNNAGFEFGVGPIPGHRLKGGSPTGGGNFYIFKKTSPEQQQAAFEFIRWITTPERAAQWSIDTGYAATSQAAYDTPALKKYGEEFPPALVARDQLPISVAEFSTFDNQRVTKVLDDALQAALTGKKTPAQALQDAQQEATRLLRPYQ